MCREISKHEMAQLSYRALRAINILRKIPIVY